VTTASVVQLPSTTTPLIRHYQLPLHVVHFYNTRYTAFQKRDVIFIFLNKPVEIKCKSLKPVNNDTELFKK